MILYQLKCSHTHSFEAWFKDSETYEHQAKSGEISCPFCGDVQIGKAPMAPNVVTHKQPATPSLTDDVTPTPQTLKDIAKGAAEVSGDERAEEVAKQILRAIGKVQKHIEDNFDDVGEQFVEEARAIHHGDAEERGIYGEASEEDATKLADEGIDFQRLSWPTGSNKKTN
ncbi:MAG: DUF1178 family protein [Rhodospirillales bacterium]|nr:DUF1178 family protein [Rhodospirillales bacterium]